jgi:hypothetical protein
MNNSNFGLDDFNIEMKFDDDVDQYDHNDDNEKIDKDYIDN